MSKGRITPKQEEILNFIKQHILSKNYPPSVREICEAVNLKSTSSVHAHLATLEKNGYISRDQSKTRAIEIVDDDFGFNLPDRELVNVPIRDYFPIPADMLPNTETFLLRVKGDSMINMGIYDGDDLLVARQDTASNGEVIVALVDDSATVKRFYKENNHYRLQPENDNMDPIIVDECKILGKVIGLLRTNIV